ncbi:hypothetical protein RQP46_006611 [Phenoliferia psychrophenolica]
MSKPSSSSASGGGSPSGSPFLPASPYGSPSRTQPAIAQIPLPPSHTQPNYGSPRAGSPFLLRPDSAQSASASSGAPTPNLASIDDLSDAEKAQRVRRHLLDAGEQRTAQLEREAQAGATSGIGAQLGDDSRNASAWTTQEDSSQAASDAGDDSYPTPYQLQGGDIVAPIYKWAAQQQQDDQGSASAPLLRRSKSLLSITSSSRRVSHSAYNGERPNASLGRPTSPDDQDPFTDDNQSGMGVREILEPGGFRRDFVIRQREISGATHHPSSFTRSFVDFLSLYGHFGGEDLEEIDEEDEDDLGYDESTIRGIDDAGAITPKPSRTSRDVLDERTPLVKRTAATSATKPTAVQRGSSRKRLSSVGQHGDATVTQAVLMLLKSFVGTGVLFLGKAFYNGGIVFSTIVLCFIAMISLYSFLLLVETRLVVHGSFGDIGGMLYGKYMRSAILFSIVLSQIGFVAAYTIFVSQNLQAFFMAVTNCSTFVPLPLLILGQLVIFLPLAMIRNIQKLSGTALIADAFILFGLVYIFSNEISVLSANGLADIALFNPKDFPLLIGTAVFSFEGIGLVIPITESMKDPHQFPRVLTGVMVGVMILFAGAGVLAYAAYGSAIQTVVFVNLPQEDRFVNAAQFLYSIAILLSTPLQLFPAVRIMENGIFSRSGKHSTKVKWEKNAFRMAVVVGCSAVAWAGASDLDKFVSLIGSVACVPLCFCYPALLHYKACAVTRKQKIADIALLIFGVVAAIYTTSQTVILLSSGEASAPPTFGKCPPRT